MKLLISRPYSRLARLAAYGLLFFSWGCQTLGPDSVPVDRFDYAASLSDSWKRQVLLNIVKLRYMDPPSFMEVGQIVAGYTLETGTTASGQLSTSSLLPGNSLILGVGGSVRFTDRPTITYTPMTGNKFLRGLMTPLPPDSVFFLLQSGIPADSLLYATVATLCGLRNQDASHGGTVAPQAEFVRALELIRKLQLSDSVAMRILQDEKKHALTLLTIMSSQASDEIRETGRELRNLLRLNQETQEFKLVYGSVAANDQEIAVRTRSLLQILNTMATQVEVPDQDIAEGRATPGLSQAKGDFPWQTRLVRIRSSAEPPTDAFVAVPYRDSWFWIDDRDLRTKRVFSFLMLLFTLADTGEREALPLITIPAQ